MVNLIMNENRRKDEELNNCNEIKVILMLLIILYHSCVFWTGEWFTCNPAEESIMMSIFAKWLNTFHIYGFTLISGYIYYYVYYERKGYTTFLVYIKKKFRRLLIPYFMIALIWVIPIQNLIFGYDTIYIIKNYFFGCSPNQLWFLLMLFGVSIIFYPLTKYMKNNSSIIIVFVFYIFGFIFINKVGNYFMIGRVFEYIIYFWLGFNIRSEKFKFVWKIPTSLYIFTHFTFFALTQICSLIGSSFCNNLMFLTNFSTNIVGAIAIFIILQRFIEKNRSLTKHIISRFSKISMPIYLFHQQLIYIPILLFNGVMNPMIIMVICFCFSLFGATILSLLFMKFKTTRFIIGEK